MKLKVSKIQPDCEDCTNKGPYWMKGTWFFWQHAVTKCPICKKKLPDVSTYNTLYSVDVEEKSKAGILRQFRGFFLDKMDKRTKKYKGIKNGEST